MKTNYFLNDSSLRKHCGLDENIHSLKSYSVSIRVRLRIRNRTYDGRTLVPSVWVDWVPVENDIDWCRSIGPVLKRKKNTEAWFSSKQKLNRNFKEY